MTEAPKRRPTAEMVESVALAALTRRSTEGASVELTRNAKGDVQIAVKVADDNPTKAKELARAIFDELHTSYPYGNGAK